MITQSDKVNTLIAQDARFARFVYDCLQRFNAGDCGSSTLVDDDRRQGIYYEPRYHNIVIDKRGDDTLIRLNKERIEEYEQAIGVVNTTLL